MLEKFKYWVEKNEDKAPGTIYSYSKALEKISEHYSKYKEIRMNILNITDPDELEEIISIYDFDGKYSDYGNKGNRTYINGLKTYKRFLLNKPKRRGDRSNKVSDRQKTVKQINNNLGNYFDESLKLEASSMRYSYELFYCLERSIRQLVKTTLEEEYGENWWRKIDLRVKENVKNNIEYELDTSHTKRSDQKIDYTTFGDLRKIINTHWNVFGNKFNRNLNSVNEVMIDLNRLRVSIAHCTPLAEKEITRLEIRVDDWFNLLKSI
ncbi:Swt1 family HEPN domain-containing protein [Gaetbulibacter saemankumensis]|uniref:Swt1 family HEPN domain-containing protein n=1 Tax=Gaetbulibacter saemankumensis TaxID=311208 RepID=UPI000417182A|nr:Swt1 family HEPN domain-containing protein [Gaetbulibacter saemankumensis]